jgi:hypothetical protein
MKTKLVTVFAALLALAPSVLAAPAGVTLTMKIVPVIVLPAGEKVVTVPVTLTLAADKAVTLQSSNPCAIHIWNVTDASGTDVENHSFCTMEFEPQYNPLTAGERRTSSQFISLHAADYRVGETYTLHYRFWGISAETNFAVKQAK